MYELLVSGYGVRLKTLLNCMIVELQGKYWDAWRVMRKSSFFCQNAHYCSCFGSKKGNSKRKKGLKVTSSYAYFVGLCGAPNIAVLSY